MRRGPPWKKVQTARTKNEGEANQDHARLCRAAGARREHQKRRPNQESGHRPKQFRCGLNFVLTSTNSSASLRLRQSCERSVMNAFAFDEDASQWPEKTVME